MVDALTPARRSANMARIAGKDTRPEWSVRRLLHKLGYRYRLHAKDLPGKPDIIFRSRRKVVFVHGCFWHQHPDHRCADSRRPKSNLGYWQSKLDRNVERDSAHLRALQAEGWEVLVVWDCEIKDSERLKAKLVRFLEPS